MGTQERQDRRLSPEEESKRAESDPREIFSRVVSAAGVVQLFREDTPLGQRVLGVSDETAVVAEAIAHAKREADMFISSADRSTREEILAKFDRTYIPRDKADQRTKETVRGLVFEAQDRHQRNRLRQSHTTRRGNRVR